MQRDARAALKESSRGMYNSLSQVVVERRDKRLHGIISSRVATFLQGRSLESSALLSSSSSSSSL